MPGGLEGVSAVRFLEKAKAKMLRRKGAPEKAFFRMKTAKMACFLVKKR
jgi:hypothetical protein